MYAFVIYDTETKRIVGEYKNRTGAVNSLTASKKREERNNAKRTGPYDKPTTRTKNWAVMSKDEYDQTVRCTKKVRNLMSGVEIEIDINTPAACDPSTETYWSM